jgi:hypothetical protein
LRTIAAGNACQMSIGIERRNCYGNVMLATSGLLCPGKSKEVRGVLNALWSDAEVPGRNLTTIGLFLNKKSQLWFPSYVFPRFSSLDRKKEQFFAL